MFTIHKILRHRIETDGKGVTTLVGLALCPLSCKYCLNKKTLNSGKSFKMTAEELLDSLMQDACYVIATGGGVTFGGGEPLLQYKDIVEFAKIRPDWMKINIETSLQVPEEIIRILLPRVDQWIIDIKTLDKDIYEKYTGWMITDMLRNLGLLAKSAPEKCKIRIPVIPNYKDKETALKEEQLIREKGFADTEIFTYVIR